MSNPSSHSSNRQNTPAQAPAKPTGPKVLATKIPSLSAWSFSQGNLTYFGPIVAGQNDVKWRASASPQKIFARAEEIAASGKDNKEALISTALKSMSQPTVPNFQIQLGGVLEEEKVEEVKQEDGSVKEVVVAVKGKNFPSAKGTVK